MKRLLAILIPCTAFTSCDVESRVNVEYEPPINGIAPIKEAEEDARPERIEQPNADSSKDAGESLEIRIGGNLSKEDKEAMETEIRKSCDSRLKIKELESND